MTTSQYKIALIVPYFGPLPQYFSAWLHSAKANPDVDFLFYTDQNVQIDAPNFRVTKTTLEELRQRFERAANRPVSLPNAYKLCDYKIAYGLFFEEELRGYDFWGYCDIDLVFGQIRHFLTDATLEKYDRFYAYGPFCLYRNNERMRRAFELPGSCFSLDEMFGPIHVSMDEFLGINSICLKNHIPWYTEIDFAHLSASLQTRLEVLKQQPNYPVQIFYWRDGRAFQRYVEEGQIKEREFLFIHWYRKKPVPERLPEPGEALVITPAKLLVRAPEALTPENMLLWNPPVAKSARIRQLGHRVVQKIVPFLKDSLPAKKVWLKHNFLLFLKRRLKKLPYP